MVQENTSNTDPDTHSAAELVDYPAPSPLNRIGVKVGLGLGLLLCLFVSTALVSLIQAQIVDEKVREIIEVEEPTSAAAYEMEINVIHTGFGVLKYLQTGDEIHRQRVAKDEADFERFKAQYDRLAETPRGRELGAQVSLLYQEYKALGDTLMDQADRRELLSTTIGRNFEELDEILAVKIRPNIELPAPDGHEKFVESMGMEANIAEMGNWLGNYLRTPQEEYKLRVFEYTEDFWEELNRFKNLRLADEERAWAVKLEDLFGQIQTLTIEVMVLEADLQTNLEEFQELRAKLDTVLDDEIQVLTHQDLAEATQVAQDMKSRTTIVMMLLLLGGLFSGILVAVAITRGITGPVSKLVTASRAIANGELFVRVHIRSKDEFGILGQSFNEMIARWQLAETDLEARVQDRTAELEASNDQLIAEINERERLEELERLRSQELAVADEVARIVTSTLNIDEVYERFAFEVKKLVDYDRMNINLIDHEAGSFTVKYLVGDDLPGRDPGLARPLTNTRTQHIVETGRTLVQTDIAKDSRFPGDLTDAAAGLLSGIMVPLITNGQVIGVMRMRSHRVGAYGPREQAILERLASQIAPAMENARLHEERVRAEERLSQFQKMESVGRLAGGVAHDFNNLLTAIMGYSDMSLRVAPPDSPISSHLQEIKKATERAAALTNQLLAFSRHQVIEPKVIDLNDLVINLDRMLRRLIGEDIELVTLPAANLEPAKADPGQIEQVLMNLAVNARDAMPGAGKLTIETANVTLDAEYVRKHRDASPGPHVMLVVTDTGSGMSEEVKEHIFEPFFTTKEVGKGTGLGLATCYGIIKQSGGHIEVCSEPGQGTSFKVYLPVTQDPYEPQPQIVDSSIAPQGKETVLLAEDEPLVRSMAAMILRDRGYEVLEAVNGEEALRVVQNHSGENIQLLLTDVVMPQMGGPELAEKLHAAHPDIRILFTSGYTGDYLSELKPLTIGTEFLAKPYLPDALAVKVREVLDQREAVPSG